MMAAYFVPFKNLDINLDLRQEDLNFSEYIHYPIQNLLENFMPNLLAPYFVPASNSE